MTSSGRGRSVQVREANKACIEVRQRELHAKARLVVEVLLQLREQSAPHQLEHRLRGCPKRQKKGHLAGRQHYSAGLRLRPGLLTAEQRSESTVGEPDRGLGYRLNGCLTGEDPRGEAKLSQRLRSQWRKLSGARYGSHLGHLPSARDPASSRGCRLVEPEDQRSVDLVLANLHSGESPSHLQSKRVVMPYVLVQRAVVHGRQTSELYQGDSGRLQKLSNGHASWVALKPYTVNRLWFGAPCPWLPSVR
jgi:hypothetical protein